MDFDNNPSTKHPDLYIFWLLAGLAAFIPLVFSETTYDMFGLPKVIPLWVGATFILIAVSLIWLTESRIYWPQGKILALLIMLIVVLIITTISSINPVVSLYGYRKSYLGLITYLSGFYLFYGAWYAVTPNRLKLFARSAASASGPIALLALLQRQGLKYPYDFSGYGSGLSQVTERVGGTIGNPNFLGIYLAMTLPLVLALALTENKRLRIIWWLFVPLTLAGLFATKSLGAWLAAAVVLILALFSRLWPRFDSRAKVVAVALIAIITVLSLAFLWLRTDLGYSVDERLAIWQSGLKLILQSPVFGTGLDTIKYTIQNVKPYSLELFPSEAHNVFIFIGAGAGLPALVIFVLLIATILSVKKPAGPEKISTLFTAFKLCFIAYLIGAQFNPDSIVPFALFWIVGGIIARQGFKPAVAKIRTPWPGLAALLVAAVVLVGITSVSFNLWRAETYARQATGQQDIIRSWEYALKAQLSWPYHSLYALFLFDQAKPYIGKNQMMTKLASAAIDRAIAYDPLDADLYYARGEIHRLLAENKNRRYHENRALANYKKSLLYNRFKWPTNYEIGKLYLAGGNKEKARYHFDLLLKLIPASDDHRDEIVKLRKQT